MSSTFQNEFLKNASVAGQSVTGSGDLYSGMGLGNGSFGKGDISANFTRQALAKQDYDRANFESVLGQNPIPGLGLSQNDILSLYNYNTGAQNAWSMSNYANQIAQANASYGAQQAAFSSIGSLVSGLGATYTNYNNNFGGFGGFGGTSGVDFSNYAG
jgi:hypothetical protein